MAKDDVFDLDALENEALATPFTFRFGGEEFTISREQDLIVASFLRRGDYASAVERLLGEEQWQTLVDSKAVFTLEQAIVLINAYLEHLGTSVGKSKRSSTSSRGSARSSKPTSNGSTG